MLMRRHFFCRFITSIGLALALAGSVLADVSIKDFGAVGNGFTDDSAAIPSAIDSLAGAGGVVKVPQGIHVIGATVEITTDNITLQGENRDASVFKGALLNVAPLRLDADNVSVVRLGVRTDPVPFVGSGHRINAFVVNFAGFTRILARITTWLRRP
jgi:hypothetical protein